MIYYVADVHLSDIQPPNRITPIMPAALEKLEYIFKRARASQGNVVFGGDLFEDACPSYSFFNKVVMLFEQYKDVPKYTILGNHDILYTNTEGNNTGIHALINSGQLTRISPQGTSIEDIVFVGMDYTKELVREKQCEKKPGVLTVLVNHLPLVEKAVPFPHILVQDFNTNADMVLCSHVHYPFYITKGTQLFINTGCICRRSRPATQINANVPSLLEFSQVKRPEIVQIPCETVEFREKQEGIQVFSAAVDSAKIEMQDIEAHIRAYKTTPDVIEACLDLLHKVPEQEV
jgi:DNA repair exonuclease SbcCD nuclease subunit